MPYQCEDQSINPRILGLTRRILEYFADTDFKINQAKNCLQGRKHDWI